MKFYGHSSRNLLSALFAVIVLLWLALSLTSLAIGGSTWDELWDFDGVDGAFWHAVKLIKGSNPNIESITYDLEWFGNSTRWPTYLLWRSLLAIPAWDSLQGIDRWSFVLSSGYIGLNHLNAIVLGLAGVALTVAIGWLLAGRTLGLAAGVLLLTLPSWTGHSWMNSKDVPMASSYLLYTLGCIILIQALHTSRLFSFGLIARILGIGLMCGARVSSLVFVLITEVILFLYGSRANTRMALSISFSVGMLLGWLLTPQAWNDPFGYPLKAMQFIGGRQAGLGPLATIDYLSTNFFEYLPALHLFGIFFSAVYFIYSLRLGRRLFVSTAWLPVVLQFSIAPVLLIIGGKSLYNELRHILFIWPPVCLLSALGYQSAWQALRSKPRIRLSAAICVLALFLMLLSEILLMHPYQYLFKSEFSRLSASLSGRSEQPIHRDYWGYSARELFESCIKSDTCKSRLMNSRLEVEDHSFEPGHLSAISSLVQPHTKTTALPEVMLFTTLPDRSTCGPITNVTRWTFFPMPHPNRISMFCMSSSRD